jgi:threonine/homoserine/homoserine lactone efflux protein
MSDALLLLAGFLAFGTIAGFISSTPLGPINLLVAEHYLHQEKFTIKYFLSGVLFADLLYAFISFWGYYTLVEEFPVEKYVIPIGSTFIIALGVLSLLGLLKRKDGTPVKPKKKVTKIASPMWSFVQGSFLCIANPGFLIYWVYMASTQQKMFGDILNYREQPTSIMLVLVLLGVLIGDLIWFGSFIKLLKFGAKKMGVGIIKRIRFLISLVLIGMGVFFLVSQ